MADVAVTVTDFAPLIPSGHWTTKAPGFLATMFGWPAVFERRVTRHRAPGWTEIAGGNQLVSPWICLATMPTLTELMESKPFERSK